MADQDHDALWAEIAATLKDLRLRASMTGTTLAKRNGWSQSKISKAENKESRLSVGDVVIWAEATGASPELTRDLADKTARMLAGHQSWKRSHAPGIGARQRGVAEVEAAATRISVFQTHVIPGLLQVPEYAEQVFRMIEDKSAAEVADGVAARMNRQPVLHHPDKAFTFVLGEGALRWRPAFEDVRAAQAERLLALQARPNITIAVLPFSVKWPVFSALSFTIFDVPGDRTVLIEDSDGERILSSDAEVGLYDDRLARALAAATTGDRAREMIIEAASD
jgi:transcriptional regulator with XRE-family HTH domain